MNIKDLHDLKGVYIKIGKTSITVKDYETGKTKGIINGIQTIDNMLFRDKMELNMKLRKKGSQLNDIMKFKDNIIIVGDDIYYLHEKVKYNDFNDMIKKYKGQDGYNTEHIEETIKAEDERLEICKNLGIVILNTVILRGVN